MKEVAAEFEALLIAQLLRSVRDTTGEGWLGGGEDQAGANMIAVAEEHLAHALAASGGLGLGDLIVSGIQSADSG